MVHILEHILVQACNSTGVVNFKGECGSPINISQVFLKHPCLEFILLAWIVLQVFPSLGFSCQVQPTLANS